MPEHSTSRLSQLEKVFLLRDSFPFSNTKETETLISPNFIWHLGFLELLLLAALTWLADRTTRTRDRGEEKRDSEILFFRRHKRGAETLRISLSLSLSLSLSCQGILLWRLLDRNHQSSRHRPLKECMRAWIHCKGQCIISYLEARAQGRTAGVCQIWPWFCFTLTTSTINRQLSLAKRKVVEFCTSFCSRSTLCTRTYLQRLWFR